MAPLNDPLASDVPVAELLELLELAGVAVVQLDPATGVARGLGAAGRALLQGAEPPFLSLIPQAHREALRTALDAAVNDGRAHSLEHSLTASAGLTRWYRTTLRRASGHVLAVMLDITSSHHNEQQWRNVESWLATLADTLPFDFWICDLEGRCVLQNPASARRVGNLLGERCQDVLAPETSRVHFAGAFERAVAGELSRQELEYTVGGAPRTYSRVVAPVSDGARVTGVLGLDIDITEMKQAQQSLLRREKLAELGVMAAVVAHEVRNPLGSISNALALVRRQVELSSEGLALCRIIEDEIRRLDEMVVNLLDFARPVSANLELRPLSSLIDEALTYSLRANSTGAQVRVFKRVDESLEPMPVDSRLLSLALTNLFRNALQAISGEGELHVSAEREVEADGEWARLLIRDTGSGIPAEVKERLFEPFVTTRSTGSGLGLTIVRRAIDAHRGQLTFTSAPDGHRGTTCVIRLPLTRPTR